MASPFAVVPVGAKPPWNHPQVIFLVFKRSPTFLPLSVTCAELARPGVVFEQSSKPGRSSPMSAPELRPPAMPPAPLAAFPFGFRGTRAAPLVFPEIRLTAPTADGPKFVPNELSLIAKFWA